MEVKAKKHTSTRQTMDVSTINELRSKLMNVEDSGWVQTNRHSQEFMLFNSFHGYVTILSVTLQAQNEWKPKNDGPVLLRLFY